MKYKLWQVREKDGSKVWLYAVVAQCSITDFIDTDTQTLYNHKGDWNLKGYGDFPLFFRFDYTNDDNKHCKEII